MSKLSWTILLVASMAGIGAFYPIVKALDGALDPYLIAFFRFSIASLILVPLMAYRSSLRLPPKRDLVFFVFLAFCAVAPTALIVMGIERTNSVVAAILINSNALMVALLAPLLIHEAMTYQKILGFGVGFIGVICVVLNGNNPLTHVDSIYILGALLLLLGALLGAVNKIYAKGYVRKYDGLYVTFFSVTLGSILLGLFTATRGGFTELPHLEPSVLFSMLAIGVISTAIPWVIWNSSLKHLDAHVAASFNLLIPVFASIYSFLFLSEQFTAWMLLGLLLTSAGIYIVQREEKVVPIVSNI